MSSCNKLSQASCTRCRNPAMVVAGSGERVISYFIMSHTCSIGERSGDLAGQSSCCKPWKARFIAVAIYGRALSYWKSTSSSCQINSSSTGYCLLYPVETPNLTKSCNSWPPCHEAWGGAYVSGANALRKMTLTRSTSYTCTSITRTQTEPSLITEDNRLPFHSPGDCFMTPE